MQKSHYIRSIKNSVKTHKFMNLRDFTEFLSEIVLTEDPLYMVGGDQMFFLTQENFSQVMTTTAALALKSVSKKNIVLYLLSKNHFSPKI